MSLASPSRRLPALGYGTVTLAFLGLALASGLAADLRVKALHPWNDIARFGAGFLRPDLAAITLREVALTVAFAVIGVGLGGAIGLALSLVFARSRTVRIVAACMRSIHELFWAMLLLQITGISAITGVLALAIPYAGIFAKVYAEIMEEADLSAERALPARTGIVSRLLFVRGPLLSHAFRSYLLYRLECGMRSTLIIGFIGVPTIGFSLETFFQQGDYPQVAALMIAFYLLIATRGLWARPATLPFLVGGSLVVLWLFVDGLTGDPVGVRLARFAADVVPAPIRTGHGASGPWLRHVLAAQVIPGMMATLVLSQLAATLSAATSLLLFPAISRRFTGRFGRVGGRAFLILLRGTPEFVAVYILLQLLGPSLLPAVIALGLHNGGIIGFLMGRHADALAYRPDAPPRRLDLYAYETLPRLYGQFMALVLYRYEIIVRESAIVGILGVRTLGYSINADFYEFRFDEAAVVLVATAALSIAIDAISRSVRRRLRIETLPTRLSATADQSAATAAG